MQVTRIWTYPLIRIHGTRTDGFGLGWYDAYSADDERNTPCIFQAITPAWSNRNLHRLAEKLKSRLVFAHVRASTLGVVSEPNCECSHLFSHWCVAWQTSHVWLMSDVPTLQATRGASAA